MKSVDLVVIGNLLIDDLPHDSNSPGGAVLFTALAARCCGLSVGVHSVVGDDYPVHLLEEAGVHLSLHRLDGPGGRTVIRYTPEGRTLEHCGPGHHEMTPQIVHPFQARMVHIAPMPTELQAFHLAACAPGTALLDPYPWLDNETWSAFRPYRDKVAALLVNDEELKMDLDEIEPDVWIVHKQGCKGGTTRNPEHSWEAAPIAVVDPTGAGDAFAAGLAAGLLSLSEPRVALQQASITASWALTDIGASGLHRQAVSPA